MQEVPRPALLLLRGCPPEESGIFCPQPEGQATHTPAALAQPPFIWLLRLWGPDILCATKRTRQERWYVRSGQPAALGHARARPAASRATDSRQSGHELLQSCGIFCSFKTIFANVDVFNIGSTELVEGVSMDCGECMQVAWPPEGANNGIGSDWAGSTTAT